MTAHARKLARELIAATLKPSYIPGVQAKRRLAIRLEEALNADEPQEDKAMEDESAERFRLVEIE